MKFFNKKQDVIDIQLTSYGKQKLANGKFAPTFYCFFDDNVIYDGECGAITENQNAIQTRILENIQYLKINPLIKGAETKLKERNKEMFESDDEINDMKDYYGDSIQNIEDKEKICIHKLGNSRIDDQKAPSFQVFSAGAPFVADSFKNHYSGSGMLQEIPQIEINLTHSATKAPFGLLDQKNQFQQSIYPQDIFPGGEPFDGNGEPDEPIIRLEGDFLVLDFNEKNSLYEKENFEFEVFEIVTKENVTVEGEPKEELIPLQIKQPALILNDAMSQDPDASYIENYLQILTDRQIPQVFRDALPSLENPEDNINMGIFGSNGTTSTTDTMSNESQRRGNSTYSGNDQDPEDCT